MRRYDAILIDFDDTLFDFKWSQKVAFERTLAAHGHAGDDALLGVFNQMQADLWAAFEAGTLTKDAVFTTRFQRLFAHLDGAAAMPDVPTSRAINQAFLDHLGAVPRLLAGAEELCRHLRAHAPLVAVTNGDAAVQRRRLAGTTLGQHFAHVVVSDDLGVGKPHPSIFRHAVALALGADATPPPERILMIGDNLRADIGGATALGYATVWIDWHKQKYFSDVRPTHVVHALAEIAALVG